MTRDESLPIIRLEVERMKYAIVTLLGEHRLAEDEYIRKAIEQFASPENLQRVIDQHVQSAISHAVKQEVEWYYRSGPGRKVVADAVVASLREDET